IRKKSKVINKALRDANIRQNTEALVIAIRLVDGAHKYNPGPNHIIREGEVLIVLAKAIDVKHIRKYIASP
ncbi:MAG: hypothetical protein HN348_11750, partial [Proteobacteria bacterium]|nr:hypothetical protein [Pseudomonadota bacterium]